MFYVKAVHGFLILLLGSSFLWSSSENDLYVELLQSGSESSLYVGACDRLIDETLKYFNAPNDERNIAHATIRSACKLYLANELLKSTKKVFDKLPKEVRLSYRESSKHSDNRKHFYNQYIKEALLDQMMSEASSKSNLKEYERIINLEYIRPDIKINQISYPVKLLINFRPKWPEASVKFGQTQVLPRTGETKIEFTVNRIGKVNEIQIIQSSHPQFSESVIQAWKKKIFSPEVRNGVFVNSSKFATIRWDADYDHREDQYNTPNKNIELGKTLKIKYKGHKYLLIYEVLPWDIAKKRAEELGGHLAICETIEELRYLWNRCGSEPMWIGLSDALVEGQWQWIDGTALDPKLVRSDKSADYVSMLEQGRASDLEVRDYANIMKRWGLLSRANSGLASKYQPSSVPPVQGYIVELEK